MWSELFIGFIGAVVGAASAYFFDNRKDNKKQIEDQYNAILIAQMTLSQQFHDLVNVEKNYLDPFRDLPQRELHIPFYLQAFSPLDVNFNSLSFLLISGYPNILNDVYVAERCHKNAINTIKLRNNLYEYVFHSATIHTFDQVTGKAHISASCDKVKILKDSTDMMYNSFDIGVKRLNEVIINLHSTGKKVFPGRNFIVLNDSPTMVSKIT